MNNTTLGNTSLLPLFDNILIPDVMLIPNVVSLLIRFPVNIYVLQLIISRHLITSEYYSFNEATFEIFICLYDFCGVCTYIFQNTDLVKMRRFFLGFIVTGHPCLLAFVCVDRYLAVVKPLVFLKLKPLKYKLALSGTIFSWTLLSCMGTMFMTSVFRKAIVSQIIMCCIVKLYCCITTLMALKKPGPGEGVRQTEGMSNIKLKAFRIILIITVSVILMNVPLVMVMLLENYFTQKHYLNIVNGCYICTAVPGVVHAFLLLQRSGKLLFIKWL